MIKLSDEQARALGLRTDSEIAASREAWAAARKRRLAKRQKLTAKQRRRKKAGFKSWR